NIIAVAAGQDYSIALRRDGHILTWGGQDRIFDGIITVPAGLINAVLIVAGPGHAPALTGIPPAAPPTLNVERTAQGLFVSWPISATNYFLESTEDLLLPFATFNNPLETNTTTLRAPVPFSGPKLFLRLKLQ